MTEELFRDDATLTECQATVLAVDEGGLVLDRTVFYPLGGGQAGDAGELVTADGRRLVVTDTCKHKERPGAILHVTEPGAPALQVGERVTARICCARWCPTRWTAAASPPAMRGWTSTWPSRWTRTP